MSHRRHEQEHEAAPDAGTASRHRAPAPEDPLRSKASPIAQLQAAIGNAALGRALSARRTNETGLPDDVKRGIEAISGISLDDVRVHRRSSQPAEVAALATAQGTEIHVAPGEERHLAHEAWHVVQQKQGRVPVTGTVRGTRLNVDPALEREAEAVGARASRAASEDEPSPLQTPSGAPAQRVAMTIAEYLDKIKKEGSAGDPEWDPLWTAAIDATLNGSLFVQHLGGNKIDDEALDHIEATVKQLNGLAALASGTEARSLKLAEQAIRWAEELESGGGTGGLGDVDVTSGAFSGRPGWSKVTTERVPTGAGQARRHVLAWHDIRKFTEIASGVHPGTVEDTIRAVMAAPDDDARLAIEAAQRHILGEGAAPRPFTPPEVLKIGLYVMNGNPRNLWAGPGKVNSAINTAGGHMKRMLAEAQGFAGLMELSHRWRNVDGKPVYKHATEAGADVLSVQGQRQHEAWALAGGKPEDEPTFVGSVKATVSEWVVSNLEIDAFGASMKQTQEAISKREALAQPIAVIDNVVRGRADLASVEGAADFVAYAIREFMTYKK